MKGIVFKFLRAGSNDDDGGVHLDRPCELLSMWDSVSAVIVAPHLPFLWVNPAQLKQALWKNYVQSRTELKFKRNILNTEIEKSKV